MATENASLVASAKPGVRGGVSFAAPTGTALPTDVTTALNAAFVEHGLISEDGLTDTEEIDSNDVVAFGGVVALTVMTSRKHTFALTFIQSLDPDVQKEVYGQDNVEVDAETGLTMIRRNASSMPRRSFVFELLLTGDNVKRIVVPEGQVTERGDVEYVDGEAVGYPVTIVAYPSVSLDNDTAREYIGKLA